MGKAQLAQNRSNLVSKFYPWHMPRTIPRFKIHRSGKEGAAFNANGAPESKKT